MKSGLLHLRTMIPVQVFIVSMLAISIHRLLMLLTTPAYFSETSAGKRRHYILPATPAPCMLIGFIAEDVFYHHKWIKNGLSRFVGGTYLPVAPVGIIGLAILWWLYPQHEIYARMWPHMIVVLCIAGVPLVAAGICARLNRFRAVMPLVVTGLVVITLDTSWEAQTRPWLQEKNGN